MHTSPKMSPEVSRLGIWDYVTCTILVLLASCIGVYHVFASRKSKNTTDFLVKSRDLGVIPLILSAAATFTSAIGFLGVPVETYNNGASFMMSTISCLLVIPFGIFLYLPVFYELEVSSIFQYLEVRFSRGVRLCASTSINIQVMLYTSCAIYAPALALNQVTGMHLWASVAAVGVICIIYTSMGGIKAVVWADATQIVVMIAVLLLVLFKGTSDLGGITEVWRICTEGKRSQFIIFSESPYSIYSLWTMLIGATIHYIGILATNQMLMQRYVSNKTLKDAKIAYIGSTTMTSFLFVCTSLGGLVMYARYHDCDPLISGQVTSRDQIMALFAMETLGFCAGLPGVFVAAILCATLSTLSSALNSLSTISMEDYIKPSFPKMSDSTQMWLAKVLAMGYGVVCIALVLVAQSIEGLIRAVFIINGVTGGPVLTLFTIGMALPWINSWGAISGFFAGLLLTGWASIGTLTMNPPMPTAPFGTTGCNISSEWLSSNQSDFITDNFTNLTSTMETAMLTTEPDVLGLYSVSSLWYASWSCGIGLVVAIVVSILTGPRKVEDVDPRLLFPITKRLFCRKPKQCPDLLGFEAKKKSYLPVSTTDPDISLGNEQINRNPMSNGVTSKFEDTKI